MRGVAWLVAVEGAVHSWLVRHSIPALRISLGLVFLGFGVLKYIPGVSPAQDLAATTTAILTFGLIPDGVALVLIATMECGIGLLLIVGKALRLALYLLLVQLLGILSPLVLLPERLFSGPFHAPTLEGQYVLKDIVLVAAAMVIATSFRGAQIRFGERRANESTAPRYRRPVTASERLAVVLSGIRGEFSVPELCRRHRITEDEYACWRRTVEDGAMASLTGSGSAPRHGVRSATDGRSAI
ncbi:MAG: DoxX family membrane protein [Pseudonocardia sp.]